MTLYPWRAEIYAGTNGWINSTSYVRTSDAEVQINEGNTSENFSLSASTCTFTLNNRDGRWSDVNPTGPYFGQLAADAKVRIGLSGQTPYVPVTLSSPTAGTATRPSTPDTAALDITGDIDLRVDLEAEDWVGGGTQWLISKWAGGSYSYAFGMGATGRLVLKHSSTGLDTITVGSASLHPLTSGRGALRVTLDVDNGAGGRTYTWYYSDTIAGTWTQFSQSTFSGTTSIFAGTALLEIGSTYDNNPSGIGTWDYATVGKWYRAQVYNGIGGTLVADFDATARTRGDTTWVDSVGRTWTTTLAPVDDSDYRFNGNLARMPQRWDETGRDVMVNVTASDLINYLQNNNRTPVAPLRYYLTNTTTNGVGYWPCADGVGATTLNAVRGSTGRFEAAALSTTPVVPGSAGSLVFSTDSGTARGLCATSADTGYVSATFAFQLPSVPASTSEFMTFYFGGATSGTGLGRVSFFVTNTGTLRIDVIDNAGNTTVSATSGWGGNLTATDAMVMNFEYASGAGTLRYAWYRPDGSAITYSNTISGGLPLLTGSPKGWYSPNYVGKAGMRLESVFMSQALPGFYVNTELLKAIEGYNGESASERFSRLMSQAGLPWFVRGLSAPYGGSLAASTPMGVQPVSSALITCLTQCAEVSGGYMYAPRDKYGITLHLLGAIAGKTGPTFTYAAPSNHLAGQLVPERVTSNIRNTVTASGTDGGQRTFMQAAGELGTTVSGIRDATISRNTYYDDDLYQQAAWDVAIGSNNELRYASVTIDASRAPFQASSTLMASLRRLRLADVFQLASLPSWLPRGNAFLLIRGRQERLKNMEQVIEFSTAPYTPYQWGRADASGSTARRVDTLTATLNGAMASTDVRVTFSHSNPAGFFSYRDAALPYDLTISGQRNTVVWMGLRNSVQTLDGSFETGVTGWTATNGTFVQSSAQAKTGTYSGLLTVTGSPTSAFIRPTAMQAVTASTNYQARCWVYSPVWTNVTLNVDWYTSGSVYISTGILSYTLTPATWTLMDGVLLSPSTAAFGIHGPVLAGSPTTGSLLYVDMIDMAPSLPPDSGTVTQRAVLSRGVDGITKALPAGASVRVVNPMTWARV